MNCINRLKIIFLQKSTEYGGKRKMKKKKERIIAMCFSVS